MRRNIAFLAAAAALNAAVMALPITLGNAPTQPTSVLIHFAQPAARQPRTGLRPAPTKSGTGRAGLEPAHAKKGTGGAAQLISSKPNPAPTAASATHGVVVQPTSASGTQAPTTGGGSGVGADKTGAGAGSRAGAVGNGASSSVSTSDGNAPAHRPPSQADLRRYEALVRGKILAQVAYPDRAKSAGYDGTVKVRVVIDARGELTGATVKVSSGFADLDDAALDAVKRAAPFAEPPGASEMRFIVPIVFRLVSGD